MKSIIRFLHLATIKCGPVILFLCALVDASFFATPVTTLFTLTILIKGTNRTESLITVITGTLAGAVAGYALGHFVLIKGEDWLIQLSQSVIENNAGFSVDLYYKIRSYFQSYGLLVLFAGSFTPVPYGMFSITSGMFNFNLLSFIFVTLISQVIKYTLITFLVSKGSDRIRSIIELRKRHFSLRYSD